MRKMIIVVILMAIAIAGRGFNYDRARAEALFLSDKMAYELNLSSPQYDAVYEINMDYFLGVGNRLDVYGNIWDQRNYQMQRVLTPIQFDQFQRLLYFYRPLAWRDGRWHFRVYSRYGDRRHFYRGRPGGYASYRGGRYYRPGGRRAGPPARRVGPSPRDRRVAPAPRNNFRDNRPGIRDRRMAPPRSNNLRGPAPRPNQGRVTRNGMVQRVGGTSRTTVTRRQAPTQQNFRGGTRGGDNMRQDGNRRPQVNDGRRGNRQRNR